jgi:DNA-binding LytR/AlgR family response regulator
MSLTCIIVEDELMSRKSLQRFCEQHQSMELLATFDNAQKALDFLSEQSVDLIWLDVEMPDLTGFDLLEKLSSTPYVILTTSKTEYAYDAFQYQVTDYVKKPVTLPRFNLAVEKVIDLAARAKATASTGPERQEIYIKTDGRYIRLPFEVI